MIFNLKIRYTAYSILAVTVAAFWVQFAHIKYAGYKNQPKCNVQIIKLNGQMFTSVNYDDKGAVAPGVDSSNIERIIAKSDSDKNIKAIILDIDSNGGEPVAGEEVANALKHSSKPTVGLIRSSGTSAAYWAATGAGRIFASLDSYVGSIGATASYIDSSLQNGQNGLTYNSLSSGEFKDMLDPNKPLTASERTLVMQGINTEKENFITAVAANRHLDRSKVEALADGSAIFGQAALSAGLIDQIGSVIEVKDYLRPVIHSEPNFCW